MSSRESSGSSDGDSTGVERRLSGVWEVGQAHPSRLWQFIQRYIGFEEPGSRWQRLEECFKSSVLKKPSVARSFSELELEARVRLLNRAYGSQRAPAAELLLSTVLALEDFSRFEPITFDTWVLETGAAACVPVLGTETGFAPQAPHDQAQGGPLTESRGWSPAQVHWLRACLGVAPAWQRLRDAGAWSDDPRVQFLLSVLDAIEELDEADSSHGALRAHELFRACLAAWRPRLPGSFLPELVLLVEGPTEAILLPWFASRMGIDLDASGVAVLAAGGANQVVRRFLELRDTVVLPVVTVLDADAGEHAATLADMMREKDRLHVLSGGEIEDVFSIDELVTLVNKYLHELRSAHLVERSEFAGPGRRTQLLNRLWKQRGLGDFDKIGFARTVVAGKSVAGPVPVDAVEIINSVRQLLGDKLDRRDSG
ncbi:MAG TPA: ATP-dependent endonuclease [Candidatus Obscuribacterales bacterium]